ncbi:unnamed protein product [Effrenium voratum]|nr:unnamed protein product [Effrenium voratum]
MASVGPCLQLEQPKLAFDQKGIFYVMSVGVGCFAAACCISPGLPKLEGAALEDYQPSRPDPVRHFVWARVRYGQLREGKAPHFGRFRVLREAAEPVAYLMGRADTPPPAPVLLAACPGCLADFEDTDEVALLPCGHVFCERCAASWAVAESNLAATCPVCRCTFGPRSEAASFAGCVP